MKESINEILEKVEKAKTKAEKLKLLKKYSSPALKAVLGHVFDPKVIFVLPKTDPPYKAMPKESDQQGRIYNEFKRFYLFTAGAKDINKIRREQLFIQMLESVDPDDAKLLCHMKNKTLPFKSITKDLIKEAFPSISTDW